MVLELFCEYEAKLKETVQKSDQRIMWNAKTKEKQKTREKETLESGLRTTQIPYTMKKDWGHAGLIAAQLHGAIPFSGCNYWQSWLKSILAICKNNRTQKRPSTRTDGNRERATGLHPRV